MKRALLLAGLALSACDDSIPGTCQKDSDCQSPAYCYLRLCVVDIDAGLPDGGDDATLDAGAADANEAGAGSDAGPNGPDGGTFDANGFPVISSFTAEPRSTITRGETAALKWEVSGATSLSIDTGIGAVIGRTLDVSPANTTTYTLTATNATGSVTATAKVTVVDPAAIASFSAAPATIAGGGSSTLSWAVTNAASVSIDNGIGAVTGTSVGVRPTNTTAYTLTATNVAGTNVSAKTTVTVVGTVGITSFSATPATITQGQSSALAWTLSGATSASIDQGIGAVSGSSVTITPTADTTYTLTASNAAGSTTTAKVTVRVVPPPKITSFSASPAVIGSGKASTLSWSVTGAANLSINNGIGAVTGSSVAVSPTTTTVYTLKATNAAGTAETASTTVTLDATAPTLTIDSPATNATCGATCTGAVFNLASASNVVFQGKAQDANGLASSDGLVANLDGQPVTVFTSGSSWQYTWQNLPTENGKSHTLTIVATDGAGNMAKASRTIYIDRVAPTCSGAQDGKRLISRTATLLQCSEPMDVASVQAAVSLTPTASGIASSDATTYGFPSVGALQAYQSYNLSLGSSAKDKVGNSLASTISERFLTEPVLPPREAILQSDIHPPSSAYYYDSGRVPLALDLDGKPSIVLTSGTYETGLTVNALRWDGKGSWQAVTLSAFGEKPCLDGSCNSYNVGDYRITSTIQPDLLLSNDYHLLLIENQVQGACTNRYRYAHSKDFTTWAGLTGGTSDVLLNEIGCWYEGAALLLEHSSTAAGVSVVIPHWSSGSPFDSYWQTQPVIIRMNPTATAWLTPSAITQQSTANRVRGTTLAKDTRKLHSLPSDIAMPFQFGIDISDLIFYGAQQPVVMTKNGYAPTGSAFLAWSEFKTSANESYSAVYLACSSQPSVPTSWNRSVDVSPIPMSDRNNNEHPRRIHIGLSETKGAITFHTDRNRVFFGIFDNGPCKTAPGLPSWSTQTQASFPTVAIGPDGTVWRTWIDTSTSSAIIAH